MLLILIVAIHFRSAMLLLAAIRFWILFFNCYPTNCFAIFLNASRLMFTFLPIFFMDVFRMNPNFFTVSLHFLEMWAVFFYLNLVCLFYEEADSLHLPSHVIYCFRASESVCFGTFITRRSSHFLIPSVFNVRI